MDNVKRAQKQAEDRIEKVLRDDPLKLDMPGLKNNEYVTPKVLYGLLALAAVSFVLMLLVYFWQALFGSGSISDANYLENLSINMKIMPSFNTYRNMQEMKFSYDKSITSEVSDELDSDRIDKGDWFFYNDSTPNYFPTLYFDEDHVPAGDSQTYCIFLKYIELENAHKKDHYRNFTGFDYCSEAIDPKFRWQKTDSKFGQDFQVWFQNRTKVSSRDDCDDMNGVYKELVYMGPVCYTYFILEQLCLSVKQNDDPDTPEVEWMYYGGCFTGNRSATYTQAEPNSTYTFSDVMVTVRESEEKSTSWLVYLFMFICITSVVLFVALYIGGKQGVLPFGDRNKHRQMVD